MVDEAHTTEEMSPVGTPRGSSECRNARRPCKHLPMLPIQPAFDSTWEASESHTTAVSGAGLGRTTRCGGDESRRRRPQPAPARRNHVGKVRQTAQHHLRRVTWGAATPRKKRQPPRPETQPHAAAGRPQAVKMLRIWDTHTLRVNPDDGAAARFISTNAFGCVCCGLFGRGQRHCTQNQRHIEKRRCGHSQ